MDLAGASAEVAVLCASTVAPVQANRQWSGTGFVMSGGSPGGVRVLLGNF